jgi:hypothetical protein
MGTGTGTANGPNLYQSSITNAATMAAVGSNPARIGLTIQNNSSNIITFTFGATVPVSQATGVQIPANTSITIPSSGMGTVGNLGAQINMIGSAAGPSNVTTIEYF